MIEQDLAPWRGVGRRLARMREIAGLSQAEAAAVMETDAEQVAAWESGVERLELDAAIRMAARTTATLDYLYLDDVSTLPTPLAKAVAAAEAKRR